MMTANFGAFFLVNRTALEIARIQDIRRAADLSRITQRSGANESIGFANELNLTRDLEGKIESQKYEIQSSKRSTDNTGVMKSTSIRSRCLC